MNSEINWNKFIDDFIETLATKIYEAYKEVNAQLSKEEEIQRKTTK